MPLKIIGTNDDLKEVVKLLINENIAFKYDGENEIISSSSLSSRGRDFTGLLKEALPNLKIKEVKK